MLQLLPKIYYDLAIAGENPIPVIIPDLTVRLKMHISDKELNDMLFSYTILDGETPEIISHKFYSTMDYNWVVMYVNNRFNYIGDFPIKYDSLENHCIEKYGADHVYDIHHYVDPYGNITDEYYYDYENKHGNQPAGVLSTEPIWKTYYQYSENTTDWVLLKKNTARAVTNFEYEDVVNESKRRIKLIKPTYIGNFVKLYETTLKEST